MAAQIIQQMGKASRLVVIFALLAALSASGAALPARSAPALAVPQGAGQAEPEAAEEVAQATLAQLPLYFVENQGQVDDRVAYYVQGNDKTLYFTAEGVTFVLRNANLITVPATPASCPTGMLREAEPGARAAQSWHDPQSAPGGVEGGGLFVPNAAHA